MHLFHVSEESDIEIFHPRIPHRNDLDKSIGLVWAINERCLPNFFTPRNCPRVTYHINDTTTRQDIDRYISSSTINHVVVIEHEWFKRMLDTVLYIYEFDTTNFILQDECAGYYVSTVSQIPIAKHIVTDLYHELFKRNVELRVVDSLWKISEEIIQSSFNWSQCRMSFAKPKP